MKLNHTRMSRLLVVAPLILFLIFVTAASQMALFAQGVPPNDPQGGPLLPGEQLWNGGASSLLFGSNDPTFNPTTSQSLRLSIRQAGITLIRTPLANNTGTEIEQRLSQIQDMGSTCLGILSSHDMTLDQQIVKQAGSRCQMYELGNEPDNPGNPNALSASAYATQWNSIIPTLRQLSPQAKFFGPVVASPNLPYITTFLQATKANTPDGVTYHMYPCTDVDAQTCLSQSVNSYAGAAQQVRSTVTQVLGRALPLGVTEWNDNWKDQGTPQESDPAFMRDFTTRSLQSLAQGQVAFANQYNLGTGTGDGHLFLTANGQPKPQLQAMAAVIAQTKGNAPVHPLATSTQGISTPVSTSSPSVIASPTVSASPQPTMQSTSGTFGQADGPTWGSVWEADASNGQVFSIRGKAGMITNGIGTYTALTGPVQANMTVEATVTMNSFDPGTNIGIVARASDRDNLYKLYLNGSELVLQKRVSGVGTILSSAPFSAQDGRSYVLSIRATGSTISGSAWLSTQEPPSSMMLSVQDSDLLTGQAGVRATITRNSSIQVTAFSVAQGENNSVSG